LLIFHRDSVGDSQRCKEEKLFDQRVCTVFNKTAWADVINLKYWIKRQYTSASVYLACENEPCLLTLDTFVSQMTKSVTAEFKKLNCIILYIPGRCPGFVQVLDVSLNKTLKAFVVQAAEDYADKYISQYQERGFTVSNQQVLLTK
jgi:hypothetical protein